jgi:beta-ureidopropionase
MAKERFVSVVAVSQEGIRDKAESDPRALWSETMERLDLAATERPDIVCLPECAPGGEPQCVPGPASEEISAWAARQSCYVVLPLLVRDGESLTNSALLIGRDGRIQERYDKIHLTESALRALQRPGQPDPPVFRTDFGLIGVQICFDVNWHEPWRRLEEKGAEIVFWPSAYPAARQLSALAWMNEYYVVSATMTRTSRIYDITGETLAASGVFHEWARARLCMGKRLFELDYQIGVSREIEARYGERVRVRWYSEEDWFTLESCDPELAVDEIVREYRLVPKRAYHERCREANERVRRGLPLPRA